jgi:hypothetical protein
MKEVQSFPETAEQLPSTHKRMRRYRQTHRRFDYYASAEAAKEIDRLRALNPRHCLGELLDYLILEASKPAVSGNGQK